MSVEIDAFCEIFVDGQWQSTTPTYSKRIFPLNWDPGANNHEFFSVLGSTARPQRGVGLVIAEKRGLPDDSCPQLASLYRSDEYTPRFNSSWLLISEILQFIEEHEEHLADYILNPLQKLIDEVSTFGSPDTIRIVFWFDN